MPCLKPQKFSREISPVQRPIIRNHLKEFACRAQAVNSLAATQHGLLQINSEEPVKNLLCMKRPTVAFQQGPQVECSFGRNVQVLPADPAFCDVYGVRQDHNKYSFLVDSELLKFIHQVAEEEGGGPLARLFPTEAKSGLPGCSAVEWSSRDRFRPCSRDSSDGMYVCWISRHRVLS